jgi:hypothetical protein
LLYRPRDGGGFGGFFDILFINLNKVKCKISYHLKSFVPIKATFEFVVAGAWRSTRIVLFFLAAVLKREWVEVRTILRLHVATVRVTEVGTGLLWMRVDMLGAMSTCVHVVHVILPGPMVHNVFDWK